MLPDKEGKRCLFCVKTINRTYELSASDLKRRQEWIDSITAAIWILAENKSSVHKLQKERRREQRQQAAARLLEKKAQEDRLAELQAQEEAQHLWRTKELHWMKQHEELQQKLQIQLQKAKSVRSTGGLQAGLHHKTWNWIQSQAQDWAMRPGAGDSWGRDGIFQNKKCSHSERAETVMDKLQMQLVMEQKEQEAGAQRQRIQELETMQRGLERALRAEIEAHSNEQTVRSAQARCSTRISVTVIIKITSVVVKIHLLRSMRELKGLEKRQESGVEGYHISHDLIEWQSRVDGLNGLLPLQ
eukprot:g35890.t1